MRDNDVSATAIEQEQQAAATSSAPAKAPDAAPDAATEVVPLPEVLRQIGRDCRKEPQQYLEETRVPLGGE